MQDLQRHLLKHISGRTYKHDCVAMGGEGVNATHKVVFEYLSLLLSESYCIGGTAAKFRLASSANSASNCTRFKMYWTAWVS